MYKDNHEIVFLDQGHNTIAYYTYEANPKNLIIFVHGFGGKSTKSWGDFPIYIKNHTEFRYSDIIFYGYKSRTTPANTSTELFLKHLKLFVNPAITIGDISRPDTTEPYKQITFVGHSLGAIIIRRTLLNAFREKPEWVHKTKIILFAPAHRGANIHRLLIDAIPDPFKIVGSVAKIIYSVLYDLEPESATITDLIKDNEKFLADTNNNNFTIATYIISAVKDKVVLKNRFCEDPNADPMENKGHISVCKPLGDFEEPVIILKKNIL